MSKIRRLGSSFRFKIRIDLVDAPVPIYREVLIGQNVNLYQLHLIIQEVMVWDGVHLFEFTVEAKGTEHHFGLPSADDTKLKSVDDIMLDTIADMLPTAFRYVYDLGDHWEHSLQILPLSKSDEQLLKDNKAINICTQGVGVSPPEDIGGVHEYAEFLKAVNDPKHEQYKDFRTWLHNEYGYKEKENYDPNGCAIDIINESLSDLTSDVTWDEKATDIFDF